MRFNLSRAFSGLQRISSLAIFTHAFMFQSLPSFLRAATPRTDPLSTHPGRGFNLSRAFSGLQRRSVCTVPQAVKFDVSISPELSPGCNGDSTAFDPPVDVSISPELSPGCNPSVILPSDFDAVVSISPELSPGCNGSSEWIKVEDNTFQSLPSFLRAATRLTQSYYDSGSGPVQVSISPELSPGCNGQLPGRGLHRRQRVSISPELSPGCNEASRSRDAELLRQFQSLPSFLRAATQHCFCMAHPLRLGFNLSRAFSGLQHHFLNRNCTNTSVSISPELSPGCNNCPVVELVARCRVSISPELSPGCNTT